jgi:hypothetical protein
MDNETSRPDRPLSMRDWFADYELSRCPECGNHSVVRTYERDAYCLDCGYIDLIVRRPLLAES